MIISVAFAGIGFYISSQYGAIIEKIVSEAINENLKSEVKVASLEVSAFEDIPYLSLVFKDVAIMEPQDIRNDPDTLIFVENLSLQFDLLDILNGNYQLKQVKINNGFGRFLVSKSGSPNFFFWKSDSIESSNSEFKFKLNNVELNNVKYSYIDKSKKVGVRTFARKANLTGDFSSEKMKLLVDGDFDATSVNVGDVQYLSRRKLEINSGIEIDNNTDLITFLQGEIRFNKAFTLTAGGVINGSKYSFDIGSDRIRVEQLNSLVPKKYSDYKSKYHAIGDVKLKTEIQGDYNESAAPLIKAAFSLVKGELTDVTSNNSVENISFQGSYTNGKNRNSKTSELVFKDLSGNFPSGTVSGSLKIEDFDRMILSSSLKGGINLSDLYKLSSLKDFQYLGGKFDFDVNAILVLSQIFGERVELNESSLKGNIQLYDVEAQFQNNFNLKNLNGEIVLDNKIAKIINLKGDVQSSDIEINGEVQNALHWIFIRDSLRSQPLRILASLKADRLDVEEFLLKGEPEPEKNPTVGISFPFSELQLAVAMDTLIWGRFEASSVNAKLLLTNGRMIMNPVHFNTMDGEFNGKIILNREYDNSYKMNLISNSTNTNIQKLFFSFHNFGQNEIGSDNIEGTATINAILNSDLTNQLELLPSTVEAKTQIKIVDGKLINYKSLKAISDYFKSNILFRSVFKADKLEESLMNVKFETLENEIIIKNEEIISPRMTIGTSVLKLNFDGKVDFNGVMDYHFDFDISELLVKDRSKFKDNESIEEDENGGIRVFIHMYGPSDNPTIETDRERKRTFKKSKRSNEKSEFKSALKDEFGWFQSDTNLKQPVKITEFDIEWEEETDSTIVQKEKSDTSNVNKKKLKDVFKIKSESETEEFDFDDDDDF